MFTTLNGRASYHSLSLVELLRAPDALLLHSHMPRPKLEVHEYFYCRTCGQGGEGILCILPASLKMLLI